MSDIRRQIEERARKNMALRERALFDDDDYVSFEYPKKKRRESDPNNIEAFPIRRMVFLLVIMNGFGWAFVLSSTGSNPNNALAMLLCIPFYMVSLLIQWIWAYLTYKFFWYLQAISMLILAVVTGIAVVMALTGNLTIPAMPIRF